MKILAGNDYVWPQGEITLSGTIFTNGGLTVRQEFAARFLQGMLAGKQGGSSSVNKAFAQTAVRYADDLIEELNKENLAD